MMHRRRVPTGGVLGIGHRTPCQEPRHEGLLLVRTEARPFAAVVLIPAPLILPGGGAAGREGPQQERGHPPDGPHPASAVALSAAVFAAADTRNRIHIPAAPCPGTPQKIRYAPAVVAVNRMSSVPSG